MENLVVSCRSLTMEITTKIWYVGNFRQFLSGPLFTEVEFSDPLFTSEKASENSIATQITLLPTSFCPSEIREILVVQSGKPLELIKLGVVNLMVPGMLPDGCIGVSLTVYYGSNEEDYDPITGCLTWLNEFAQKHNELLRKELTRIQELYPNVSITYADYYNAGLELFLSPKKYGFNDESRLIACCGSGGPYNVDDDAKCGYPSSHACDDPSSYIQWDGAHLTQAAYQWIAKGLLSGLYTSPNITASCSTSAKWI
nr:GDSL esterase/lipase At1g28580-like [Ipomoea batatas]